MDKNRGVSKADYGSKNVAPLIESFAALLGIDKNNLLFKYPTIPSNESETVGHPGDSDYLSDYIKEKENSSQEDMNRYEAAAKNSVRLKKFQQENDIVYFQSKSL